MFEDSLRCIEELEGEIEGCLEYIFSDDTNGDTLLCDVCDRDNLYYKNDDTSYCYLIGED